MEISAKRLDFPAMIVYRHLDSRSPSNFVEGRSYLSFAVIPNEKMILSSHFSYGIISPKIYD
jgi:hypothetical protein